MTISNSSRTAGPYIGNGVTTDFPFAYKVFTRADLLVARTVTATGVESILVIDSDYTVILNTDQNTSPGGIIRMLAPLAVGTTLAATSNLTIIQPLDLTNGGGFYPKVINDALDRIVINVQQLSAKIGLGSLNIGTAATIAAILAAVSNLAIASGSNLIGFIQSGIGAVLRTVQSELRDTVKIEQFGGVGDGIADDTAAFKKAVAKIPTNGCIQLVPGRSYRITDTITMVSKHLFCPGKAEIIADLNDLTKDALFLSATQVRLGSGQAYVPACCLAGVTVRVISAARDGIRLAYGDFAVWDRIDVQNDPVANPIWRDGVHIEADADGHFIENLDFRAVRIHDAPRDAFRFEVPATGTNVFINVGTYYNCEVRGAGQRQPGSCVRFVSNNLVATEKISSHTFTGGEYAINSTPVNNPNPDAFKAVVVAGGAPVENIHINGATAECIPTYGTGLAVNTTGMTRVVLTNFLPFGFQGAGVGVGGTGDWITVGYLGLDHCTQLLEWLPTVSGETNAGAPVYNFRGAVASRVGKICNVAGQVAVTSFGGATGNIKIGNLPWPVLNRPFALFGGTLSEQNTFTLGTGYTQVAVKARPSSSFLSLVKSGSNANTAFVQVSEISAPCTLTFSITYNTD